MRSAFEMRRLDPDTFDAGSDGIIAPATRAESALAELPAQSS
jgi:hypothetical protein